MYEYKCLYIYVCIYEYFITLSLSLFLSLLSPTSYSASSFLFLLSLLFPKAVDPPLFSSIFLSLPPALPPSSLFENKILYD